MQIILGQSNIDDVRAQISKLEDAEVFDQRAWAVVLMAIGDSPSRRADAVRRMETAKGNQAPLVEAIPMSDIDVSFLDTRENMIREIAVMYGVAVETEVV